MRLEQLQLLIDVVETHSMSEAAKKQYVTPQNVSKSIKQLEDELGTELLIRTNQGVYPTKNGEIVFRYAKDVAEKIDAINALFKLDPLFLSSKVEGSLKLYVSWQLNDAVLDICSDVFDNPNIKTQLLTYDSSSIVDLVSIHHPDAIFVNVTSPNVFRKLSETYDIYPCGSENMCAFVGRGHELASEQQISLSALSRYPSIAFDFDGDLIPFFEKIALEHDVRLKITYRANSYRNLLKILASKPVAMLGVPSMYECLSDCEKEDVVMLQLKESVFIKESLFVSKERANEPVVQYVVNQFSSHYRGNFFKILSPEGY